MRLAEGRFSSSSMPRTSRSMCFHSPWGTPRYLSAPSSPSVGKARTLELNQLMAVTTPRMKPALGEDRRWHLPPLIGLGQGLALRRRGAATFGVDQRADAIEVHPLEGFEARAALLLGHVLFAVDCDEQVADDLEPHRVHAQ